MVFSSLIFLFLFLPLSLFSYFLLGKKNISFSNFSLLISSLLFYFYGEPKLILVMLGSIILNYSFGILMHHKFAKIFLILCISINLSCLCYFKYSNFFISNFNFLFGSNVNLLNVIMPIGISFFTFQSLSYVVDVYRKEVPVQKNIINLALYISMFPQLIAGPIVRYKDINNQIEHRVITSENFSIGVDRFIFGLSKKILLSNVFAQIADQIFAIEQNNLTFSLTWFGAIIYSMQIYFDFSGYSDMAIGLGKMFGFNFLENFNYPYISKSVSEFWRRWHISLSTWFRDYIYIPLGGNRCGKFRNLFNILCVWILTGFWHGASYNFIVWGLYFAILLIVEKHLFAKYLEALPVLFKHIYSLFFIIIGWVIFRTNTISEALIFIKIMLIPNISLHNEIIKNFAMFHVQIIVGLILCTPIYKKYFNNKIFNFAIVFVLFGLCCMSLVNNSYNPFIYFRF